MHIIKLCVRMMLGLVVMALLFIAAISLWFSDGKKETPWLSSYINRQLSDEERDIHASSLSSYVEWKGITEGFEITLNQLTVMQQGSTAIDIPAARVKIDILNLFLGQITFENLSVSGLIFYLNTPELLRSVNKEETDTPLNILRKPLIAKSLHRFSQMLLGSSFTRIDTIELEQTRLVINNGQEELVWLLPSIIIAMHNSDEGGAAAITLSGKSLNHQWNISADLRYDDNDMLAFNVTSESVPLILLADILPEHSWLYDRRLKLKGNIQGNLRHDGIIQTLEASLRLSNSQNPEVTDKKKKAAHLLMTLDYQALLNQPATQTEKLSPRIEVNLEFNQFSMANVKNFWPPVLKPKMREWVLSNIPQAIFDYGSLKINIKPEDWQQESMRSNLLLAVADFHDASLKLFDELPLVTDIQGSIIFDINSLDITANNGQIAIQNYPPITLKNTRILLPYSKQGTPSIINVDGTAKHTAKAGIAYYHSLASLIEKLQQNKSSLPKIEYPISGKAKTDFSFSVPLLEENQQIAGNQNNSTFHIVSQIDEGTATIGSLILENARGNISISPSETTIQGTANALGLSADGQYRITHESPPAEQGSFTLMADAAFWTRLNPWLNIEGNSPIQLSISNEGKDRTLLFESNLTDNAATSPWINWKKTKGQPLNASMLLKQKQHQYALSMPQFKLTGSGLNILGEGKIDDALTVINMTTLKTASVSAGMTLHIKNGNEIEAKITADKLDFSQTPWKNIKTDSNKKPINVTAVIHANNVQLHQKNQAKNASLSFTMEDDHFKKFILESAILNTMEETSYISIALDYHQPEAFVMTSTSLGDFLSAINTNQSLKGGVFQASATGTPEGRMLSSGRFWLKDFALVNAPLLANLLSFTSFSSAIDTLKGEGITFEKARGTFIKNKSTLEIQDLQAKGGAFGLTSKGTYNTDTNDIAFNGSLIPAYTLNTFVSHIPVFGKALAGGEGEGLIATRYSMKGKSHEPKISVNPLSTLTPGFLRNFWKIFESDESDTHTKQ